MKPCHVLSLSLSPKAALTTRAPCFPVDVPCHEHVPKGKSLCWTSPTNVCLWDRPAARGKWDTETTPEENISKGSRIKIQPGTILTPTQGQQGLPGVHQHLPQLPERLSTHQCLLCEKAKPFLVKSQSSAVYWQQRARARPQPKTSFK